MVPSLTGQQGVTESGKPVADAIGVIVLGIETIGEIPYVSLEVFAGSYSFGSMYRRVATSNVATAFEAIV
jgi:hypothetical protein